MVGLPHHACAVEQRALVVVSPALSPVTGKHVAEFFLEFHWKFGER